MEGIQANWIPAGRKADGAVGETGIEMRQAARSRNAGLMFAATIFLSAFLLFQVQPLISRILLPWFGGAPAVWTTCLLFFQCLLCGGYCYSHLLSTRVRGRGQLIVHSLLVVLSVFALRILPDPDWKPSGAEHPVITILGLLGATVGLPYFLLSTTGPLLLRWYSLVFPQRSPHRLYALSNAGSLLALMTYPLIVDPLFAL